MKTEGWVKLYRKVLENPFCEGNAERLGFWTTILLMANHRGKTFYFGNQSVTCSEGQFATGRKSFSEKTNVSEMKVERWLNVLEDAQQIAQQKNNKFRLITVKNWKQYQTDEQQNAQHPNNKRTTDAQQTNTNKNVKNVENEKKLDSLPQTLTPKDTASDFFEKPSSREPAIRRLVESGSPEAAVRGEMERFVAYWTEPNKAGTRQRWQMEKTFEVGRRLDYWIGRSRDFAHAQPARAEKPKLLCSGEQCFIDEQGKIRVKSHDGWKDWGGYSYEAFSYGNLYGHDAVKKAKSDQGISS